MQISISAVSGNRKFTKSLVRHSHAVNDLRNAAISINTDTLPYDTLQIVFLDRDQDYLRAVGCKGDRLFQVEVATPNDTTTDYGSEASLITAIAEKAKRALEVSGLSADCRQEIARRISLIVEASGDR